MVIPAGSRVSATPELSVLALSSRFDGRLSAALAILCIASFSTRSVESF